MQLAQLVLACALGLASAASSSSSSGGGGDCDNYAWYKKGNPSKDCDWVARYTEKRCSVKGYIEGDADTKVTAEEGCPGACGYCFGAKRAPAS